MGDGDRGRPEVAGIAESSGVLDAVTALDPAVRAGEAAAAAAVAAERTVLPGPRSTDLTAAAFFDVDNTMMMGASIFHFARGLAARKFFTTSRHARLRLAAGEVPDRRPRTPTATSTGRDNALAFVAGRPVAEIVELGEEIYDELMADRIWAGTRALAQMHLDAGQRVWLVTATPVELAQIIARPAGPDRGAGHGRRERRRHLHRPAGRRAAARAGEGGTRCARWPSGRGWTCAAARPTRTR